MKHKSITILIVFMAASLLPISTLQSNAAIKAGAKCTKAGQVKKSKGATFICAKQGNKLTWRQSVAPKPSVTPSPIASAQPQPSPSPSVSQASPTPTPLQIKDARFKRQGEACTRNSADVLGYDQSERVVVLMCNQFDDRYFPRPNAPIFNPQPEFNSRFKLQGETCAKGSSDVLGYDFTGALITLLCNPRDDRYFPRAIFDRGSAPTQNQGDSELGGYGHRTDYVAPKPITGMPTTKISESSELAPIEQCKIKDAGYFRAIPNNPQRHFVSGFPNYPERANFQNKGVMQIVPVDFSDLPGRRSPAEDLKEVITFMTEYFTRQASMPIEFKIRVPDKYIRMPKTVAEYNLSSEYFSGRWKPDDSFNYAREAIRIADPFIDFTGASMLAIAVPAEVTRTQIGAFIAQSGEPGQQFRTSEGEIYNMLIMAGPAGTKAYELLNWAHETAHLFGLTDIRNTVDVSRQDSSDLGLLDLMNSMLAPELLAWQRFILGILFDDQVRCVTTTSPTTHRIVPVAQQERLPKAVVIPTETYKGIVVESRRRHGYDTILGTRNEGIFVYTVDTTIPYRYSTMKLVPSPTARDTQWRRDAALLVGESVVVNGWKITYVEKGSFGDVVRVERT